MSTTERPDPRLHPLPTVTPANNGNNDGTPTAANMLTVGDALVRLAENLPPNVTAQAAQVTRKRLASLRRSTLAPKQLSALTVAELAAWLQQRIGHVRPAVAGLECSLLLRALGISASRRGVTTRRAAGSPLPTRTTGRPRRVMDASEIDKLLDAADALPKAPWLCAAILLVRDARLRVREVLMLEWRQVDLEAALVDMSAYYHSSTRRLSLSERTVCALAALPRQNSERVFAPFGTTTALHVAFRNACEAAGVEALTLNDLRRFSVEEPTR